MRKMLEYTWLEFKVQFRVPIALFFTIFFPVMLLTVFVISTKNAKIYGDLHFVDVYLPVMMLLALFSAGIVSFAIIVAGSRGEKVWQVYRMRGFKLYQIILVQLFVNILIALISVILLVVVAYFFFHAKIPDFKSIILFSLTWLVIAIAIFLIGFVIGVFCKDDKVAQAVSTPLMFVLMFLSGIMVKQSVFPKDIQNVLLYLPTNQANLILIKGWSGLDDGTGHVYWAVIVVWILLALALVIWKLYRDDFRRI